MLFPIPDDVLVLDGLVRFERELEARVRRRAGYALLVLRRTLTKGATHDRKETALRARALRPARSVAGFS